MASTGRWHRESRFWRFAPWVLLAAFAYDGLAAWLAIQYGLESRLPAFPGLALVIMGGAGAKSTVDQLNQGRTFPADDRGAG